jgi:hypothetical protein
VLCKVEENVSVFKNALGYQQLCKFIVGLSPGIECAKVFDVGKTKTRTVSVSFIFFHLIYDFIIYVRSN